jgi:hypothetical protein
MMRTQEIMLNNSTRLLMRKFAMRSLATLLCAGAVPLAAQDMSEPPGPPTPPSPVMLREFRSPRPPRPPRDARPPREPRDRGDVDGVARIDTVVPFSANGSVELSLISGKMKVSTWSRNQVRVVASTSGPPSLQFDASGSHLSLEQSKNGRNGNRNNNRNDVGSATYEVTVPVGVRASLSAVSGDITASGIHGRVEVSNVSGSVNVRDAGTSLDVEGVSGDITLANVGGDAHVENVSGRVSLTGVGGSANVETVSGDIVVNGVRGDRIHATTVSGDIDFAGALTAAGRYEFETHSGQTTLRLASNANGTISVESFSGSVSSDYPGAVRRRSGDDEDSRSSEYVIGKGEGRIHVDTFSGDVQISRGNQ